MSAIFFLNETGRPLLSRNYRGDVPMSCVDEFPQLLERYAEPCFVDRGVNYVYIRHADLIIMTVSRTPQFNVLSALHFLYQLVHSFETFVQNVEVESVVDNFVVLYELLDEMMDFGHIQTTDTNILQDYVTQSSYKLEVSQAVTALTDQISWRPPGIWYKKNELFVDVVETLSTRISSAGQPLSAEIVGVLQLRTFLSGMPRLKLGLNNKDDLAGLSHHRASRFVKLRDVAFHQCVSLDKWDEMKSIEFVPPDGKFDLLTYRVDNPSQETVRPLFKLEPVIEIKQNSRILIKCTARAQYKKRQQCTVAEFSFPVPQDCDSPRFKSSHGSVVYAPENQVVVWKLSDFSGSQTATMQAELLLARGDPDAMSVHRRPIMVRFEMPGTALSGLHIKYLKIDEAMLKYHALPWVRYLSKSGEYEVRHNEKIA